MGGKTEIHHFSIPGVSASSASASGEVPGPRLDRAGRALHRRRGHLASLLARLRRRPRPRPLRRPLHRPPHGRADAPAPPRASPPCTPWTATRARAPSPTRSPPRNPTRTVARLRPVRPRHPPRPPAARARTCSPPATGSASTTRTWSSPSTTPPSWRTCAFAAAWQPPRARRRPRRPPAHPHRDRDRRQAARAPGRHRVPGPAATSCARSPRSPSCSPGTRPARSARTRVAQFSLVSLENQVQEWFEEDEASIHLRDKAFLVALAAFDGGPYALTAELSDLLYRLLQQTENPVAASRRSPSSARTSASASNWPAPSGSRTDEHTEWGPVPQQKASVPRRAGLPRAAARGVDRPSLRPARADRLAAPARRRRPSPGPYPGRVHRRRPRPHRPALGDGAGHRALGHLASGSGTGWSPSTRSRSPTSSTRRTSRASSTTGARARTHGCAGWPYGRTALIGPERPEQALAALRKAVRRFYEDNPDRHATARWRRTRRSRRAVAALRRR